MVDIRLNSKYLSSDRGVCKIIQIILGFVICGILCANWLAFILFYLNNLSNKLQ